ncbi:MAG TPA: glutathione S-transferase family protein [Burkholderiales bacterium]|jgi:glutathione S-transferase
MIEFYGASGSPYVWRVWFALEHKHAPYDLKMLSFSAGDLKTPAFVALNPRRKVPVVVDGDVVVYESAAIVEYLEDRFPPPSPPLLPAAVGERAIARRLIREIDEYLARAMESMVEEVLFTRPERWNETAIGKVRGTFVDELARFEGYAPTDGFFVGAAGAVDHALYPIIALALRLERRKPDIAIKPAVGVKLAAWMRRVESLPYFAKTYPPHWKET